MSVNQVLSQSDSVEEASQRVLDVLCKSFDWEFVAIGGSTRTEVSSGPIKCLIIARQARVSLSI